MNIARLIKLALKSIGRNRTRTLLTMLGIIIGVASVIAMLAIGEGSKKSIEQQISEMGSNMIFVMPGAERFGPARGAAGNVQTLTVDDADAIRQKSILVKDISPQVSGRGQAVYGANNWATQIQGAGPEYFDIRIMNTEQGVLFTQIDIDRAAKVCVIGQTIVKELFDQGENPIGKMIRFNKIPFKIIGVLESKGESNFGQDQDDIIIAPYTTVQKRVLAQTHLSAIYLSAVNEEESEETQQEITKILREQHNLAGEQENDFNVRSQQELLSMLSSTSEMMTILLASIAGISLFVGGIGIMNIMFVSVTERTREIGLRMAVGAQDIDIMLQFLIEAVIVIITGGIIGMLLGIAASTIISNIADWPTLVIPFSIILSFLVCAFTVSFYRWYPAVKASRLNPIEVLRYE